MENLTAQDCYKELKAVELEIKELKARRLELLKKGEETDASEKAELEDYVSEVGKLEADKAKWFELLQKAQSRLIVEQGILLQN
jgi:hypothetical protein